MAFIIFSNKGNIKLNNIFFRESQKEIESWISFSCRYEAYTLLSVLYRWYKILSSRQKRQISCYYDNSRHILYIHASSAMDARLVPGERYLSIIQNIIFFWYYFIIRYICTYILLFGKYKTETNQLYKRLKDTSNIISGLRKVKFF